MCVHIFSKESTLVRSIGKRVLGSDLGGFTFNVKRWLGSSTLGGIIFDLKGNVWVVD